MSRQNKARLIDSLMQQNAALLKTIEELSKALAARPVQTIVTNPVTNPTQYHEFGTGPMYPFITWLNSTTGTAVEGRNEVGVNVNPAEQGSGQGLTARGKGAPAMLAQSEVEEFGSVGQEQITVGKSKVDPSTEAITAPNGHVLEPVSIDELFASVSRKG